MTEVNCQWFMRASRVGLGLVGFRSRLQASSNRSVQCRASADFPETVLTELMKRGFTEVEAESRVTAAS
jgi:hypothetical protein